MKPTLPPLGLYIHIPWCIKKCPYCDFNSHAVKSALPENIYIDALLTDLAKDIQRYEIERSLQSIFIGGGTPSLFSPEAINRLLDGVKQHASLTDNIEITLEANPGTFESTKFAEFNALGVNRLSIGVQSFQDPLLTRLGRVHNSGEAIKAAEIARQAGFDNFNLDLMFGLPDAEPGDSENDIATAISLKPSHISLYQLTLEPNTWFHKFPPKLPDDETVFSTQKNCQQLLTEAGYRHYEVSAYGQPGRECKHNVNYWQFGDYLGIGAGAHGKISLSLPDQIIRTVKPKSPEDYMQTIMQNSNSAVVNLNNTQELTSENNRMIAARELPLEFVMNQLRLTKGFSMEHYRSVTGLEAKSLEPALSQCQQQGLIKLDNGCYVCTEQGWNFLDTVLGNFIS